MLVPNSAIVPNQCFHLGVVGIYGECLEDRRYLIPIFPPKESVILWWTFHLRNEGTFLMVWAFTAIYNSYHCLQSTSFSIGCQTEISPWLLVLWQFKIYVLLCCCVVNPWVNIIYPSRFNMLNFLLHHWTVSCVNSSGFLALGIMRLNGRLPPSPHMRRPAIRSNPSLLRYTWSSSHVV